MYRALYSTASSQVDRTHLSTRVAERHPVVQGDAASNDGRRTDNQTGAVVYQNAVARNVSTRVNIDGRGVAHQGHRESWEKRRQDGDSSFE